MNLTSTHKKATIIDYTPLACKHVCHRMTAECHHDLALHTMSTFYALGQQGHGSLHWV